MTVRICPAYRNTGLDDSDTRAPPDREQVADLRPASGKGISEVSGKGKAAASTAKSSDYSWRFHATHTVRGKTASVYYVLPAREPTENRQRGKQRPWGVDCYSLGRLLYNISGEDTENTITHSERVAAVDSVELVRHLQPYICS